MSITSVMPSNHLILCHPLLLSSVFPSIRVFSNVSVLRIRWPECWSFSFSISPSNEYSGLISFRMDWLDLLGHIIDPSLLQGLQGDPTLPPRSPGALWWSVLFQLHPGVRLKRGWDASLTEPVNMEPSVLAPPAPRHPPPYQSAPRNTSSSIRAADSLLSLGHQSQLKPQDSDSGGCPAALGLVLREFRPIILPFCSRALHLQKSNKVSSLWGPIPVMIGLWFYSS